jgi:arylsulfatase A-like enzyme
VLIAAALPGLTSALLVYRRLGLLAVVLLAAGLAVRIGMYLAARPTDVVRRLRQVAWAGLAITLLIAAGMFGTERIGEHVARARLSPAARNAPNVLLLVLDTVRASRMSLYGYGRPTTPFLEKLAAQGVTFEWAISPSSWTLPSHGGMFTGYLPEELNVVFRAPLDTARPTVAEELRGLGYLTGGFVANGGYCHRESGLARGFLRYEDFRVSPAEGLLSFALGRTVANSSRVRALVGAYDIIGRKTAADINRDFLAWIESADRPFFAFLNYLDAHEPYQAPSAFQEMFGPVDELRPWQYSHQLRVATRWNPNGMSRPEAESESNAYDAAIAYLDYEVGRLIGELDRRGQLTNTVVIVTSDHGEHFGEYKQWRHAKGLYLPAIHVPLIVSHPGSVPRGQRVTPPVGLQDVGQTIFDLATGEESPRLAGRSLKGFWDPGAERDTESTPVIAQFRDGTGHPYAVSVISDGFQYIRTEWPDRSQEQLYALESSAHELKDQIKTADPRLVDRLRQALLSADEPASVAERAAAARRSVPIGIAGGVASSMAATGSRR